MDSLLCTILLSLTPCPIHQMHIMGSGSSAQVRGLAGIKTGIFVEPTWFRRNKALKLSDPRLFFSAVLEQSIDPLFGQDLKGGGYSLNPGPVRIAQYRGWSALKMGPEWYAGPAFLLDWIPGTLLGHARDHDQNDLAKPVWAWAFQSMSGSTRARRIEWGLGRYHGGLFLNSGPTLYNPWFFYANNTNPIRSWWGYGIGIGYQKMDLYRTVEGLNPELQLYSISSGQMIRMFLDLSGHYPSVQYSRFFGKSSTASLHWQYHPALGHRATFEINLGLGGRND